MASEKLKPLSLRIEPLSTWNQVGPPQGPTSRELATKGSPSALQRAAPLHLFGNFLFGNNFKVTEKLQIQNKEMPCTLYPDSPITYISFTVLFFLFLNCLKAR